MTHELSTFLLDIIKLIRDNSKSYVRLLWHITINDNDKVVSLDVESRYTNVPTGEFLSIIKARPAACHLTQRHCAVAKHLNCFMSTLIALSMPFASVVPPTTYHSIDIGAESSILSQAFISLMKVVFVNYQIILTRC